MSAPALSQNTAIDLLLRWVGNAMMRHQRAIQVTQWLIVVVYLALLIIPTVLPLPDRFDHLWSNLTLISQFVFWGIWWPFMLLSLVLVGRLWCGVLCPEGFLAEQASAISRGWSIPHWVKWKGWPFVAFALTTVYGQMVSVYQYPKPALVILGFSTVAAIGTAIFWGRHKRVWCRYLCPVTGVLGLLSKLAPVHFQVDTASWDLWSKPRGTAPAVVNCAPLVPIRTMRGNAACHMCGRCSGFRGAVTLARRSPNHEIIHVAGQETSLVQTLLLLFGLMGIAAGAFHWGNSELFIAMKQALADWLVDHDMLWPLEAAAPWWLLTNYPDQNDVMSLLDGGVLLAYIGGAALLVGLSTGACLAVTIGVLGTWSWTRFHHLVQCLIPIAGTGVILGLSMTTVSLLRHDGFALDFIDTLRAVMLAGAAAWSLWLGWRIAGLYAGNQVRRLAALLPLGAGVALCTFTWATLFWPH